MTKFEQWTIIVLWVGITVSITVSLVLFLGEVLS